MGYQKAVLVFFETLPRLNEFYKFAKRSLGPHAAKITEETSALDKEGNISAAVTSGRITLLTRAFGRGTDFICYDDRLQANGGIHVIQTFFSFNKSEEIQIKGRTARQGNVGFFSLVLLNEDLNLESSSC
jgi:preprotein translocase subunit SecA